MRGETILEIAGRGASRPGAGYTEGSFKIERSTRKLADTPQNNEKLYKAEYVGSGTFIISKPKRNKLKRRQSELKNRRRGSRK